MSWKTKQHDFLLPSQTGWAGNDGNVGRPLQAATERVQVDLTENRVCRKPGVYCQAPVTVFQQTATNQGTKQSPARAGQVQTNKQATKNTANLLSVWLNHNSHLPCQQ